MKKILPLIAVISCGVMLSGCSNNITSIDSTNIADNINQFEKNIKACNIAATNNLASNYLNKYNVSVETPSNLETTENEEHPKEDENLNILPLEENDEEIETLEETENNEINVTNEEINTLYSLSNDIEQNSELFINLKEDITNAIIETENLLAKIKSNELDLTREQRIFLTEQSSQLKNLGKQLSNITTELNFNLSDLQQILKENNNDMDNLSLKYLIVLDNLINGNEMLQSGLTSINLMNQMLNLQPTILPPNNQGRIIYGFRKNNNPPTIKEYVVDDNGELIENKENNVNLNENSEENEKINEEKTEKSKSNIDTYNTPVFKHNIDTYYSDNPKNIDTFFNTALLDNELMYGRGYNGYNYGFNPYINQYAQYENSNKNNVYSDNETNNTQGVDKDGEKIGNKERKDFKLTKNIDTYLDKDAPTLKKKFEKIRNSLNKIFNKN